MKRSIVRIFMIVSLVLWAGISLPAMAQQKRTHIIKQGETLYRLTQMYQISAEEICAANPGLSATVFPIGKSVVIPGVSTKPAAKPVRSVKIAVALPFGLEEEAEESARMLEFYQGFLLAVDTLKKQGVSVELHTYDTGKESASIQSILENENLKQVDFILGGYHWGHIKQLSEFAKANHIKMILPFSSNDFFVSNNPELFMINTPQPYLYPVVQQRFKLYFPDAQIFFLSSSDNKADKLDFIESFKYNLIAQKVPYELLSQPLDVKELGKKLKKKKEILFIPVSGSTETLDEWMPLLTDLQAEHKDKKIHLFGYPEWQTYMNRFVSRFYNLDTFIYTTFYTSNIFPSAIRFNANFKRWYHKEPTASFPRFSMLGYDIGLYFVTAVAKYGNDFTANLSQLRSVPTLQNGFSFERVNEYGGFVNKNIYFINFSKDMEIIKTELQ